MNIFFDMKTLDIKSSSWWAVVLLLLGAFVAFTLLYSLCQWAIGAVPHQVMVPVGFVLGVAIVAIYALVLRVFEKRWTTTLNLKRFPAQVSKGLAVGALYFLATTGLIALCGCYKAESVRYYPDFLGHVALFFLVACGEEVMFRGVLFRIIDKKWGMTAALVVSAVLFGGLHIFNEDATVWSSVAIAVEAGLMLGVAYKCSGTLWLPIGIHWIWNLMEGPVLGFAVSGIGGSDSIISPVIQGPDIITGGAFGAEASIFAAALGLAVTLLIWRRYNHSK